MRCSCVFVESITELLVVGLPLLDHYDSWPKMPRFPPPTGPGHLGRVFPWSMYCSIVDCKCRTVFSHVTGEWRYCRSRTERLTLCATVAYNSRFPVSFSFCNYDFEIAINVINAFRSTFPFVATSPCRFHFDQVLWRNIQRLGLTDDYKSGSEVLATFILDRSLE